jgi:hypothetical protein
MSNESVVKYANTSSDSTSCRVIPFPKRTGIDFANTSSSGLIDSTDQITKETIEAIVYEILIKEKLLKKEQDINPFGSIYLCDLKPDNIDYTKIKKIKIFANIQDLSDSIFFNDGMDD